ncbi:acyl-CoA dehydratase activase [Desulfosarcina sp. OttesenSCG-928-A07]|nr:acyl-CoA dehydratase activase [Desulfosarcina sp. OttesenSCG-928-A07]
MIVMGIDIGSVAAKAVVLDASGNTVLSRVMIPTGWDHRRALTDITDLATSTAGISSGDIHTRVLTGYGRVAGKDDMPVVSEIACHAKGAHFLFPEAGSVIDIGGQDSKAICLGPDGAVTDFAMNDKCAAGTGRFVSMVATLLGHNLDAFAKLAEKGNPLPINSMCAVFAESEIVGLLAKGHDPADIAAGVCHSIASRTAGLASRLGFKAQLCVFSGGLAGNPVISTSLETHLSKPVIPAPFPQFVGALGAAILASQQ